MFNALKYIKVLEGVGFGRDQAEAQVQLVMAAIEEEMATKSDILEVRTDFAKLRGEFGELKGEFAGLRGEFAEFKIKLTELQSTVIFKLGAITIACSTIGFTALGLLITLK